MTFLDLFGAPIGENKAAPLYRPRKQKPPLRPCKLCGKVYQPRRWTSAWCSLRCYNQTPEQKERLKLIRPAAVKAVIAAYKLRPWHTAMKGSRSRKDDNHNEVAAALRKLGCSVHDTSPLGYGFPDLIVGLLGQNFLIEVKNRGSSYGRHGLTELQQNFSDAWRGASVVVLHDADEATAWVSGLRRRLFKAHEED